MIPRETVELILDTARVEEVVGDFVTLKRRGANYVACCPFHNEKTPSFYVSPAKGLYKCFGCGKAGTAVGFVMEQEHCSYVEALRYLARRYNIEIQEEQESAEEIANRQRKESLLLVSEFAQKFFAAQLSGGEGHSVGYAYFKSRGLEDETISRFGLGWAPSGRTSLIDAAAAKGYKLEYLVAAGLAVQREDGTYADKFRERVMFPIHTVSGRVVGFSGRTLRTDNPAKYVNSPETEIYIKSRNLLGIWLAKAEISREDRCILVEGNVDMVMMHQVGIRNVVASCGTSLTKEQVQLIHKFTSNVTILYDGDSAGIHAALRGLELVLQEGMDVKIVLLPDGEDPDSFSRKHTLEEVKSYIVENERDFIGFKSELMASDAGTDPLKRANLVNDIADTIAEVQDAVKRSMYVEDVARRFNLDSGILFDRIAKNRRKAQEDALKAAERARRQREAGLPAVHGGPAEGGTPSGLAADRPQSPAPSGDTAPAVYFEDPILAPVEKELLSILLQDGTSQLDFETDSPFYSGDEENKPLVAEFVSEALEADGAVMSNVAYRKTYDAYMQLFDEGYEAEYILRKLCDSQDRTVASVAAELYGEKYDLTVQAFRDSLTTKASWLVSYVPKTLMVYGEKRLQSRLEQLRKQIAEADEAGLPAVLQEYKTILAAYQSIRKKTGKENKSEEI